MKHRNFSQRSFILQLFTFIFENYHFQFTQGAHALFIAMNFIRVLKLPTFPTLSEKLAVNNLHRFEDC